MDVCGVEIGDSGLIPHFWTWSWGASELLDVTALLPEISYAKAVMPTARRDALVSDAG